MQCGAPLHVNEEKAGIPQCGGKNLGAQCTSLRPELHTIQYISGGLSVKQGMTKEMCARSGRKHTDNTGKKQKRELTTERYWNETKKLPQNREQEKNHSLFRAPDKIFFRSINLHRFREQYILLF